MVESKKKYRRIAAELLGYTLRELFPQVILLKGGLTKMGFFYEFSLDQSIAPEMLQLIEETLRRNIKKNLTIYAIEMMRENAVEMLRHYQQDHLANEVATYPVNIVPLIQIENHYALGKNPEVKGSAELAECCLLEVQNNEIKRIEGVVLASSKSRGKFLKKYGEWKKNNYHVLGPELDLFCNLPGSPSGSLTWLPKGMIVRDVLIDWWKKQHPYPHYGQVYAPYDGNRIAQHAEIFRQKCRSYRDFPLRYAEMSDRDVASIFCTKEQVLEELISSLHFIAKTINIFGFDGQWLLAGKGTKATINLMNAACDACGIRSKSNTDEEKQGELRLEVRHIDSMGQEWIGPSVAISDLPKKLGLNFQSEMEKLEQPYLLVRSLFDSIESLIAMLVEKHCGVLPLWLAPEQVRVIPVGERYLPDAQRVQESLSTEGIRTCIYEKNDTLAAKIYAAKRDRVPHVVIIGDKEKQDGLITVRSWDDEKKGKRESLESFLNAIKKEIDEKTQRKSTL